jgi:hypothetical protein
MGIQNVSVSCRTLSVVLCIVFLLFQVRRKESTKKKKRRNGFPVGRQTTTDGLSARASLAIMYYKTLIDVNNVQY